MIWIDLLKEAPFLLMIHAKKMEYRTVFFGGDELQ